MAWQDIDNFVNNTTPLNAEVMNKILNNLNDLNTRVQTIVTTEKKLYCHKLTINGMLNTGSVQPIFVSTSAENINTWDKLKTLKSNFLIQQDGNTFFFAKNDMLFLLEWYHQGANTVVGYTINLNDGATGGGHTFIKWNSPSLSGDTVSELDW